MMMGGGPDLDILIGLDDPGKPLRSKLLAVPALRARYIAYAQGDRHQVARLEHPWSSGDPLPRAHRCRREGGHSQARFDRGIRSERPGAQGLRRYA